MGILDRNAFLGIADSKPVIITTEFGDVMVRGLTALELDEFEQSNLNYKRDKDGKIVEVTANNVNRRARLVALGACDDKGNRLFVEADAVEIGKKPASVVSIVADKIASLSGIGVPQKEIEKNSESSQS